MAPLRQPCQNQRSGFAVWRRTCTCVGTPLYASVVPHTSSVGGGGGSVSSTAGGGSGIGVVLTHPLPAWMAIGWLHGTHWPTHTKLGPGDGVVGTPYWANAVVGIRAAAVRTA